MARLERERSSSTPSADSDRAAKGHLMRPDELERRLRERLDALGPAARAELLHVLVLPDCDRADRIREFCGESFARIGILEKAEI